MNSPSQVLEVTHVDAVKAATDELLKVLREQFPFPEVARDALLSAFVCIAHAERQHGLFAEHLQHCATALQRLGAGEPPVHIQKVAPATSMH
jgi:hypothetical protein